MTKIDDLKTASTVHVTYNSYDDTVTYDQPSILAATQDIIKAEHNELQKLLDDAGIQPISGTVVERVTNLINEHKKNIY